MLYSSSQNNCFYHYTTFIVGVKCIDINIFEMLQFLEKHSVLTKENTPSQHISMYADMYERDANYHFI
jgi:hypothetical protein